VTSTLITHDDLGPAVVIEVYEPSVGLEGVLVIDNVAIIARTDVAVETGDINLMKSEPAEVLGAICLSKATFRQLSTTCWPSQSSPYPSFGLMFRPEFGALAMSASSITVVSNALLLRRALPSDEREA
jgi:cation transport ATPase